MVVTIKDIKEYLSKMPDDTPVELDKDGWMEHEIDASTVQSLIYQRGLFQRVDQSKFGGGIFLIINN